MLTTMITSLRAIIQPRQERHMGEGRAVEGRKSNPPVCLATPLLTVSPKAFLAKDSVRVIAFLPGFASRVEIAVTHSKQTVATFLPGSRIARRLRQGTPSAVPSLARPQFHSSFRAASPARAFACTIDPGRAQISIAKPLSNREL